MSSIATSPEYPAFPTPSNSTCKKIRKIIVLSVGFNFQSSCFITERNFLKIKESGVNFLETTNNC